MYEKYLAYLSLRKQLINVLIHFFASPYVDFQLKKIEMGNRQKKLKQRVHKEKNEMERKGKKKHRLIRKPQNLEPEEGFQTHSAASSMPKLSFPTSPRSCFFLSGKDH